MDTNPLAADPDVVVGGSGEALERGLRAVARLSGGATYLCLREGSRIAEGLDAPVTVAEFAGPHPSGTAGVHIHLLDPVGVGKTVWTIGYQDVVSIGNLLGTGWLDVNRVVAIGGPPVARPRLVRTRVGCSLDDFRKVEGIEGDVRWISGSVLSGKAAAGEVFGYMGRYDQQISVLPEGGRREFLSWLAPGATKFSVLPAFLSSFARRVPPDFSTDTHGSPRVILPIGVHDRVMPMDILPTFLLRALAVNDVERAEELGCLELDEEDLALCAFVDPGKADFGPMLRRNLEQIERG
jgi:Na+-transporting NADH:ubiquinone oxidoreductase subunit A